MPIPAPVVARAVILPPFRVRQPIVGTATRSAVPLYANLATIKLIAHNAAIFDSSASPAYLIYINGVLRSDKVSIARGLTISKTLGQWDNASFSVISTDGTYRPEIDQEVVIVQSSDGTRVFGGDIESPGEQHEDGTSIIWTNIKAVGYGARLDRRAVAVHYDTTITWQTITIINDLLVNHVADLGIRIGFGGPSVGSAYTTEIILQWGYVGDHIRKLAEPEGLDVVVDEYARLYLVSKTQGFASAPFNLTDSTENWDSNTMTVERLRGRYANEIIGLPDLREPGMWTDEYTGDEGIGLNSAWFPTTYIQNEKPVVLVNGTPKTVGVQGTGTFDFTYNDGGFGVQGWATYTSAHTIKIIYPSPLQPAIVVRDEAEIASYGRVVSAVEQIKDVHDRDRMVEIFTGILTRRKVRPYSITYRTQEQGLRPGHTQTINTTQPLVSSLTVLIESVSGTYEPRANGGIFRWQVKCGNSPVVGEKSGVNTKIRVREALMRPQDRHRQVFSWDIAKTVDGLTNEGTTAMVLHGSHEVTRPGYLKEIRLRFDDQPLTATVQAKVYLNAVSVTPAGQFVEFRPADVGTTVKVYNFTSQPFALAIGDRFTAEVITGDAAAKDGILEVEQQG